NPFIREKRDGRRAPGYLVYLLAGVAAFAAVAILHSRTVEGRPPRVSTDRGARVSPITQAASSISPVKVERKAAPPQERSFRLTSRSPAWLRPPGTHLTRLGPHWPARRPGTSAGPPAFPGRRSTPPAAIRPSHR